MRAIHIHLHDSITKGYSASEVQRQIASLKQRLQLNAVGLSHARGARRQGYLQEKAELEQELKAFSSVGARDAATGLTGAQQRGLEKLIALQSSKPQLVLVEGIQMLSTGVNTAVLHALKSAGYISVSRVYLNGRTTPDLKVLKTG